MLFVSQQLTNEVTPKTVDFIGKKNLMYMECIKRKVGKVHPVQALRLCSGRTAHRGSRGIALLFHDHSTRRG
jgi:hypothetical protein